MSVGSNTGGGGGGVVVGGGGGGVCFFFNDTATTEIYTLSLHDALPICRKKAPFFQATQFNKQKRHNIVCPQG